MSDYLNQEMAKPVADRNFGLWYPPEGVKHEFKCGPCAVPHLMEADEKKDTGLWPFLFKAFPNWKWGIQGTGDCVSWEWKQKIDVLMAVLIYLKNMPYEARAETASESIYGFGRVEIFGRPDYGGAGMYGGGAAKAVTKYGTLHRMDYGGGNDLTEYSGRRAVSWGRTGVPDELEPTAAEHRAGDSINVTGAVMAGALIQNGYPVGYCGRTTWGLSRDEDGIAARKTSGAHGMCITGVRYKNGEPYAFWVANTGHGNHCSGPVGPIPMPEVYAQCGSWMPTRYCERVFQAGDCFAHSLYEGFPAQKLPDWGSFEYL